MRSYEMTEIGKRDLDVCLDEAFEIAMDECDAVFVSVDIDVCDPGHAPGTGRRYACAGMRLVREQRLAGGDAVAGIKAGSSLLPGHGGGLDRLDGLLAVAVAGMIILLCNLWAPPEPPPVADSVTVMQGNGPRVG